MERDDMFPWPYGKDGLSRWWSGPAPGESSDQRLARLVTQRLRDDPWTRRQRVRVEVQNRVVILEGHVDSARARWAAVDHAWQTPGVYDVCDVLTEPGDDDPDDYAF
jgi:osmotically-inducible protein OsmY